MVKFTATKFAKYPSDLTYAGQTHAEANNVKLLGLQLDNNLTWKTHTEQLLHN
jgi:hypothetical protein